MPKERFFSGYKEKLRNDLFNKFGLDALERIDKSIDKYADEILGKEPYMSVLEKFSELITQPENLEERLPTTMIPEYVPVRSKPKRMFIYSIS